MYLLPIWFSFQTEPLPQWQFAILAYEYSLNGRLWTVTRPNGTKMTRLYDDAGQLLQQKDVVVSTGEILSQFDFTYDAAGDIVQEQMLPELEIEVDPLEMIYSAANRLATYDEKALKFDADGNMTKGPLSGNLVNFAFDSRNRLISAGNTAYRYDAENQRVGVSVDGQETRYVVNSQPALSQVLVTTQPDGTQTYYVYGLGLLGQEQGGEYKTYHFDLRGSTVALTDASGQITERFQYSPYGLLLSGDASKTPFLFNGMYGVMTDASGLYYMRARFYNPEIKRFVNQDILLGNIEQGQTLNRYAYVTSNPINFIDPLGLVNWGNLGGRVKNNTINRPILLFNWDLKELIILEPGEYSSWFDYDVDYVIDFIYNCDKPQFTKIRNLNVVSIEPGGEWEIITSFNPNRNGPIPATPEHIRLIYRIIYKDLNNFHKYRFVRDSCQNYHKQQCGQNYIPIEEIFK